MAGIPWTSFAQFEKHVTALSSERERGEAFERFVCAYLRITPELDLAKVWSLKSTPRSILGQIGLPRRDVGVDFVARRRDGSLWVIQAKFRVDHQPVPWRELSTFVGAGGRAAYRLLIGNQTGFPLNLPQGIELGSVFREDLLALQPSFFRQWVKLERAERPRPPARFRPRPDQLEAIDVLARSLQNGGVRAQLIAACGTGKTVTALWTAERLGARRILYFAPSLALVHQSLKTWIEQATPNGCLEALCVCSDETVGDVHRNELPIPVKSDRRDVRRFWEATLAANERRVIFVTYQSLDVMRRALRGAPAADLLIADEAHRIAGAEGKPFQAVLDERVMPARRWLFMTATPRILASHHRRRAEEAGIPIVSMDDPAHFGSPAYELSFGDAIKLKLLADYKIHVLAITDTEVRRLVEMRQLLSERFDAETVAQAVAVAKALKSHLFRYVFTFHSSKRSATDFRKAIRAAHPKLFANSIFGTMPVKERRRVLRELLETPAGVVSSARALTEGVDAPAVDAVAFVDPKSSVVDIVQAVGRALRRDPKRRRKRAHIVVPVVVGRHDAPDEELAGSAWAPVWNVLRAMRAHDQRLADTIDTALRELGRRAAPRRGDPGESIARSLRRFLDISLPPGMSLARFRRAVALRALDEAGDYFEYGFGVLQRFAEREGHTHVHLHHREGAFRLGSWVSNIRTRHRIKKLSDAQEQRLEKLPSWSWNRFDDEFFKGLAALHRFGREKGDCNVPLRFKVRGFALGKWVSRLRSKHKKRQLAEGRTAALEAVPGWTWDLKDAEFQRGLGLLRQYVAREGDARVSQGHREGGMNLGSWVNNRRNEYRKGELSKERQQVLEGVQGWDWNPKPDFFARGLNALRRYVVREKHARVPKSRREGNVPLGKWVQRVRGQYRKGELSPRQRTELETLPGWSWDPFQDSFERGLTALRQFVKREGHARVSQKHGERGFRLGTWVSNRRAEYKKGRLAAEKKEALERFSGWTWGTDRGRPVARPR